MMKATTINDVNQSENLEILQGLLGESFDVDIALRVLKKFNNDLNQAAAAILEGDTGESTPAWQTNTNSQASGSGIGALNAPQRTNTPCSTEEPRKEKEVIDLTGDYDSELSKALAMSLESDSQSQSTFGPSTRAPDPNWALVPSNVPAGTTLTDAQAQEDHSLSRAIEASLSTSFLEDKFEDIPPQEKIREPDHPVALRTTMTEFYFATLVLHALFHVPQVRKKLARWRKEESSNNNEVLAWYASFIFAHMDLSIFSVVLVDPLLQAISPFYEGKRAVGVSENPGDLSNDFYTFIARALEEAPTSRSETTGEWYRLFHMRYAPDRQIISKEESEPGADDLSALDIACARVDVRGTEETNDLLSCLTTQLGLDDMENELGLFWRNQSTIQTIVSPSEVIAFQIVRQSQAQAAGPLVQTRPFRYPKHVYLDQFLRTYRYVAKGQRKLLNEMKGQLKELSAKKDDLTKFQGKDTLKSLESSVYYLENIAPRDGTPTRGEEVKSAAMDLRKILTQVENEIQALDTQISHLRKSCEEVFDHPLLQGHRYDLRAVLVHDGLFGRNHIYSFVHHNGKWWKTQDSSVVEVSEELVLTDNTGLHLGAGPYMLIYSRATEENDSKTEWSAAFMDTMELENEEFICSVEAAAPEKGARLRTAYTKGTPLRARKVSSDTSIASTSTVRGPSRSTSVISISGDEGDHAN